MYGITYLDKHSFEHFGVTLLNTRVINTPSKKKVTATVPFMNGNYDFSSLYGATCFDERVLEYEFLVKAENPEQLEMERMKLDNWLLQSNSKTILKDDILVGYYYLAECRETIFEEINNIGKLVATFVAYPFKIRDEYEGNMLWDTFNFELDRVQQTVFGTQSNSVLYNDGLVDIVPTIVCDTDFNFTLNGVEYEISPGETIIPGLILKPGPNTVSTIGIGTIQFLFRKEVL